MHHASLFNLEVQPTLPVASRDQTRVLINAPKNQVWQRRGGARASYLIISTRYCTTKNM